MVLEKILGLFRRQKQVQQIVQPAERSQIYISDDMLAWNRTCLAHSRNMTPEQFDAMHARETEMGQKPESVSRDYKVGISEEMLRWNAYCLGLPYEPAEKKG